MKEPCEYACTFGEIRCVDCGMLRKKHAIKFQLFLLDRIPGEPWMEDLMKELEAEIEAEKSAESLVGTG